jgi:hypothetical protein
MQENYQKEVEHALVHIQYSTFLLCAGEDYPRVEIATGTHLAD